MKPRYSLKAVPLTSTFAENCQWSAYNSYRKYRIKNWPHGPIVEGLETNDPSLGTLCHPLGQRANQRLEP
jgi:hypothetical protein